MRSYILTLIVSLCFPFIGQAQFCTGTLGDNIFTEGNFGTGTANLLSPDPGIALGYNYTFNVPPFDGEYVITNSTASWGGLFDTWLPIGDNSDNPTGYMMVVNASNAPGIFYEQTISGLCENTLYEFSADIINLIKVGIPDHIDPNVSFLLDGVELFSTGDITETGNWTTYGFTFTTGTGVGAESLTLSLRNNAPGGNGNDLAIDNISFRACGPQTLIAPGSSFVNLCEDDSSVELQATILGSQYVDPAFQWQESFDGGINWVDIAGAVGQSYTHPISPVGMYYYRLLVADGVGNLASDKCRVNSDIKTINIVPKETMQVDTICDGLTLTVGNSDYTETGIYLDTFVNFLGCDSILITDLTVQVDENFSASFSITQPCANDTNGSISVENVNGGTPPFSYVFEGTDFGTTTLFSDLSGGETYSVLILDNIGCSIETPVFVENLAELILELGETQTIELGETVDIEPTYNFTPSDFIWQTTFPIECLDFEDCDAFSFQPIANEQVRLDLFTEAGCSISDSVLIDVVDVRKAWLPNAFSPNEDGVNDYFTVLGKMPNVQMIEEFKIFDRWGALVFENESFLPNVIQEGWDGTYKGERLPDGVYIYTAIVRFLDEEIISYSGDIFLTK